MRVEFQVTGPTRGAIRAAVARQLELLNGGAVWQLDIDVTPAFRADEGGGTRCDWCGEVRAWDGEDTPPPRLPLLDDDLDGP